MGAYFKLTGSETRDVTPELAAQFSQMAASTTERDLKSKRLTTLKDAVLNGAAITFCWARATDLETGKVYRVNGHHSSTMLAGLNGELPNGLKAHIDDYEVANKEALVMLFRQFDSRVSARTIEDISGAYQGLYEDLAAVPKGAARKAVEGAAWFLHNKRGDDIPHGDDRYALFNRIEMHPFIQMAGRILSVKTPEFSTPVIGAMYGAWERHPAEAEEFFGDVAKQGGSNDNAVVLDIWLVEARDEKENKPTEQEVYYACAMAWNAFRNHKVIARIPQFNKKKGSPELD